MNHYCKCGREVIRNISRAKHPFKCIPCQEEDNRKRAFLRGRRVKAEKEALLAKNGSM